MAAVRHPSSHAQLAVGKRAPPISNHSPRRNSVVTTLLSNPLFPAIVYQARDAVRPNKSPDVYLSLDLKTPRLNAVHRHLWIAGLPHAARPLHRQ